ncbi:MAG: Tim44 domain-containing protein [Bauldia sp.]|uniref:Tim44/TimA family putative adaptor protein n=1 Tax=Bauldia sp. TaxID=2575872 RepID=UPI001DA76160|nr:Tim44/TimA family putative adaptor protein [Bauldia sp.]MCB1497966.1 Tim44 domain-containing protein [Bauldia sp.]
MNGFVDIYTIIFLVLAVVIFFRLRNVLGRRTGNERPPFDPYSRHEAPPTASGDEKVISLPPRRSNGATDAPVIAPAAEAQIKTLAPEGSSLNEALRAIATADRNFDPDTFIAGAKGAYEMIVTAFAEGDRKTLKQLLSREVYDGFVAAITEREGRQETIEFRFVGIDKAEITDASLKGGTAQITVRFLSKLISATHDKEGNVIDGDPVHVGDVTDIWTFARDVASRDPNWKLVATESVE